MTIHAEDRLEMRELVTAELSRLISPRTLIIFVSILLAMCGLTVWKVFEVWETVAAQNFVIDNLRTEVRTVTTVDKFSTALDKNTAVMTKLAEAHGLYLTEEGGVSGEPDQ